MIIRIPHKEKFTQVSNKAIRDKRLSLSARGLLIYLLSQVDGWNFNAMDVANNSTDSRYAIYKAMKELQTFGYAEMKPNRDARGRVRGKYCLIKEDPDSPNLEIPNFGHSDYTNTD